MNTRELVKSIQEIGKSCCELWLNEFNSAGMEIESIFPATDEAAEQKESEVALKLKLFFALNCIERAISLEQGSDQFLEKVLKKYYFFKLQFEKYMGGIEGMVKFLHDNRGSIGKISMPLEVLCEVVFRLINPVPCDFPDHAAINQAKAKALITLFSLENRIIQNFTKEQVVKLYVAYADNRNVTYSLDDKFWVSKGGFLEMAKSDYKAARALFARPNSHAMTLIAVDVAEIIKTHLDHIVPKQFSDADLRKGLENITSLLSTTKYPRLGILFQDPDAAGLRIKKLVSLEETLVQKARAKMLMQEAGKKITGSNGVVRAFLVRVSGLRVSAVAVSRSETASSLRQEDKQDVPSSTRAPTTAELQSAVKVKLSGARPSVGAPSSIWDTQGDNEGGYSDILIRPRPANIRK